jgi:hypothetical protein
MRMMPRNKPGKNPRRIAPMGNLLQVEVAEAAVLDEGVGIMVAGALVDVGVGTLDEETWPGKRLWSSFSTQLFTELQVKPHGQHELPQVGRLMFKYVVFSVLSGCAAASCVVMSQVIGLTVEQSSPAGQQRTVVFAASGMQTEVGGQQKPAGRPAWGHRL